MISNVYINLMNDFKESKLDIKKSKNYKEVINSKEKEL